MFQEYEWPLGTEQHTVDQMVAVIPHRYWGHGVTQGWGLHSGCQCLWTTWLALRQLLLQVAGELHVELRHLPKGRCEEL